MSPTFHVITVHFESDRWMVPQLRGLDAFMPESTRRYGVLNDIPECWRSSFDWWADLDGDHGAKLNQVADMIAADAPADDLLVFIDGDAFPVAPITTDVLAGNQLAAVRRDECLGDPIAHPCFCMTTVGLWRDLGGDWSCGPTWVNDAGAVTTDVGATLWRQLEDAAVPWTPLLRSAEAGTHPLYFAVYGDVAYHHGAGFRRGISRVYRLPLPRTIPTWVPVAARAEYAVRYRLDKRRRRSLQRALDVDEATMYQRIVDDPAFVRRFRRVEHASV